VPGDLQQQHGRKLTCLFFQHMGDQIRSANGFGSCSIRRHEMGTGPHIKAGQCWTTQETLQTPPLPALIHVCYLLMRPAACAAAEQREVLGVAARSGWKEAMHHDCQCLLGHNTHTSGARLPNTGLLSCTLTYLPSMLGRNALLTGFSEELYVCVCKPRIQPQTRQQAASPKHCVASLASIPHSMHSLHNLLLSLAELGAL
jgi:hypothetical protein